MSCEGLYVSSAAIFLEGGPLHGQRVLRNIATFDFSDLVFPTLDVSGHRPRVARARYAPTGRVDVAIGHNTLIYVHQEPQ